MAYSQPSLLSDALRMLEQADTSVVAGGTDFYPALENGGQPGAILDVTRIAGFGEVTRRDDYIRIGAAVTWSDLLKLDLPPAFDALKQAAREVGSLQIQNAGTIAGNICNASPAADGVPPLLALDARVEVSSAQRGARVLSLDQFILGVRQTALHNDELVTAVLIPKPPRNMLSGFEKLGSRKYLVISIVMTAANIVLDEAGRVAQARIAVGSCSTVAQRLFALERELIGQNPERFKVTDEHLAPLAPIDDVRGTAIYRLDAVREQIARAVKKALQV